MVLSCRCHQTFPRKAPFFFFKRILFLFRERGWEGERERNINVWLPLVHPLLGTWPTTQALCLTGNQNGNPLVPRPPLNPLSHTSQGGKAAYDSWSCGWYLGWCLAIPEQESGCQLSFPVLWASLGAYGRKLKGVFSQMWDFIFGIGL